VRERKGGGERRRARAHDRECVRERARASKSSSK